MAQSGSVNQSLTVRLKTFEYAWRVKALPFE